jgi:hypothetical protein
MIKFSVHSENEPQAYAFADQESIAIGANGTPDIDIVLTTEDGPSSRPLVIVCLQKGEYYALNVANDPFITINGEPFGRRNLKTGDSLEIGSNLVVCDLVAAAISKEADMELSSNQLTTLLAQAMTHKNTVSTRHNTYPNINELQDELDELELLASEPWSTEAEWEIQQLQSAEDIDALVREVEALEWEEETPSTSEAATENVLPPSTEDFIEDEVLPALSTVDESIKHPLSPYHQAVIPADTDIDVSSATETHSKTDEHLVNHDDNSNTIDEEYAVAAKNIDDIPEMLSPHLPENGNSMQEKDADSTASTWWSGLLTLDWRWGLGILATCILIITIMAAGLFMYLREQRKQEELKAAQGVADIAMALTYSHFNQIRPQKQNWADPAFLRKNLGAVLATQYQILAHFDAQGQFTNTPYLLRIYTNHDLSQFLVMAQPAPSITHWILPKATIIVDSRAMELRKFSDVRAINRLLVHAKTFDGAQAEEISQLTESGQLIPLDTLATHSKLGFVPPKALAIMQPAAANRIYNAPRYFLFGERILNKIFNIANSQLPNNDQSILLQDLQSLTKLPHLVLYSTEGIQIALEAQKALAKLEPLSPLWIGTLKLGSDGQVINGQLLPHSDYSLASAQNTAASFGEGTTLATLLPAASTSVHPVPVIDTLTTVNEQHPLMLELHQLKQQREASLRPIIENMTALLQDKQSSYRHSFNKQWLSLNKQLQRTEAVLHQKLRERLTQLLATYSYESLSNLAIMVQHYKLDEYDAIDPLQINLLMQQQHTSHLVTDYLHKLKNAHTISELATQVETAHALLRWEYLPHPKLRANYQQLLLNLTIQQLTTVLLSPAGFSTHMSTEIAETPKTFEPVRLRTGLPSEVQNDKQVLFADSLPVTDSLSFHP